MTKFVILLALAIAAVLRWKFAGRDASQNEAIQRLRAAIDNSNLPARSRDELTTFLDQRRMRPSDVDRETG